MERDRDTIRRTDRDIERQRDRHTQRQTDKIDTEIQRSLHTKRNSHTNILVQTDKRMTRHRPKKKKKTDDIIQKRQIA